MGAVIHEPGTPFGVGARAWASEASYLYQLTETSIPGELRVMPHHDTRTALLSRHLRVEKSSARTMTSKTFCCVCVCVYIYTSLPLSLLSISVYLSLSLSLSLSLALCLSKRAPVCGIFHLVLTRCTVPFGLWKCTPPD